MQHYFEINNFLQAVKIRIVTALCTKLGDGKSKLTVDNNKGIVEIIYNHLNLPKKITFDKIFENNTEVKGTIEYLYNANGTKLKKTVKVDGNPNHRITHYTNGYQYSGDKLDFFPTAEGYVNVTWASGTPGGPQIANYNYVYNYTDHLGNIRNRCTTSIFQESKIKNDLV